jgi:hypothetical protein
MSFNFIVFCIPLSTSVYFADTMAREIYKRAAVIDDVEVEASLTVELYFSISYNVLLSTKYLNSFLFWIIKFQTFRIWVFIYEQEENSNNNTIYMTSVFFLYLKIVLENKSMKKLIG